MKKNLLLITLVWLSSFAFSQTNQTFNYQTVARSMTGQILENQNVSFRISIIQGELPGKVVYAETQLIRTSGNGLLSLTMGQGEAPKGDIPSINQDNGSYFIQLEIDANGGNNYSLMEISRLSGDPHESPSPPSGNVSSGNDPGSVSTIPGENAESLVKNVNIFDEGTHHENSFKETLDQQVVGVPQGWTGLSSYIVPDNPDIESLFLPVQDQLIMLFSQQGVYYPSQQLNTLVNWDSQSGYLAKFNQETNLAFTGQEIQNGTINLTIGWNLLPVLSGCPVSVETLIGNDEVTIVKEAAGWKLYWPEMGINTLNELLPGKAYYVLMNSPAEISFPECIIPDWHCGDVLVDMRDGRTYETVLIGAQCWMAQNLNFGSRIDGTSEQTDNDIIEKYCYNNNVTNCNEYGGLYQWDEMMQYSVVPGVSGICPTGWYLPDDAEWNELTDYLGGMAVAGGKMKEMGTTHWSSPNTGATNSSGFTGLPGGFRGSDDSFNNIGFYGNFWTASKTDATSSKRRYMTWNSTQVTQNSFNKFSGLSVRCRRDDPETAVLMVNPESHTVSFDQGVVTFDVTSNTAWIVQSNQPWITVTPESGINNQILTVNYEANEGNDSRVGEIILTALSGFPTVTVTLTQAGLAWMCGQPFVDERDGSTYNTVQVGAQCWMAQNLNLGSSLDIASDQIDNGVIERYCYDNNNANCNIYGGLYQWDEMMQYSIGNGVKGICPESWHVPGLNEWDQLCNFLGGYAVAGGKMKETGTIEQGTGLWHTPNTGATNSSGFTVLPGGYRMPDSLCYDMGYFTIVWSSSLNTYLPVTFAFFYESEEVMTFESELNYGNAVRCIKDADAHAFTSISPSRQYVTYPAGSVIFSVNANTTWTVSESVTWLSVEPAGGSSNGTITVNYGQNSTPIPRTGIIEVFDGINLIELMIIQDRFIPELTVTPANQDVSPAGGTVNFDVISNTTWNVTESVSWLSVSPASGSNNGTLAVTCEANGTNDNRTGTITITATVGTPVVTVTVTQIASVLTVSPENQEVTATAGATTFAVTSNTTWTVEEIVSWLSVSPINGSLNGTLAVTYESNTNPDVRIGQITITAGGGTPVITVTVTQAGNLFTCGQPFTDARDGQSYVTVKIGDQCWMAENLNIGTRINGTSNQTNNSTIEKYCNNNAESNCITYGGLYQWNEMMGYTTTAGVKGICPDGWHLPTDAEWTALTTYVSNQPAYLCNSNTSDIAKALAANTNWNTNFVWCSIGYNLSENNATGFTALPGGRRNPDGSFVIVSYYGEWWSSSAIDASNASQLYLQDNVSQVLRFDNDKSIGFSVRCLKDEAPTSQLEVTPSNQNVSASAGSTNFVITSNTSWTVTENNTWLTVSPMSGSNNGTLTVTYDENTSTDPRIGQITLTAEGGIPSVTVSIIQEGFSPFNCGQSFTDTRDGQTYTTVQIGTQCWMAENLNIGTSINATSNQTNNGTIEKYCFDNNESNCEVYGGFYLWDEMMNYSTIPGSQGICPEGWHLPYYLEWSTLITYLGGEIVAGGKMKTTGTIEEGTGLWYSPNTGATNESGFSGLPGGISFENNGFCCVGGGGWWWSSTEESTFLAHSCFLGNSSSNVFRTEHEKYRGLSVRCLFYDDATSQLLVTPPNQDVSFASGITTFEVSSNTFWTIDESVTWLSVSPTSSSNNGTLTVNYDANTSADSRTGQIIITATGGTPVVTVTVTQAGAIIWNCGEAFTDQRDGKTYTTIQIGTQCWMKQNLNMGNRIDGINEQSDNGTIEKFCYDNLESNCDMYGGLYQWDEMMQFSTIPGIQGICPTGWHLPTDAEWTTLTTYLGGESVAGGKMKESGTAHWNSPNTGATNSSGFTGLPGGYRITNGTFTNLGRTGDEWSSTEDAPTHAWDWYLYYNDANVYHYYGNKSWGFSVRCLNDETITAVLPTVTTASITNITQSTATSGGNVTNDGGATVTEKGVCWSTSQIPTIANTHTSDGTGTGSFISNVTGLLANSQYYLRAYATNSVGTAYGDEVIFTTSAATFVCGNALIDTRDGQTYTTVQIGTQCWMAENLNIGTRINGTSNQTNNGTIEKYCYENTEASCTTYGGLYQWDEMMQYTNTAGVKGICPTGWHLPTDAEWTTLTNYVRSQPAYHCYSNSSYIAKALASTTNWNTSTSLCAPGNNLSANNATGFTALPTGCRDSDGYFYSLGNDALLWSSTGSGGSYAFSRNLYHSDLYVDRRSEYKVNGFSVHCLKD